ncbi:lysine exporter LysO family protein [Pseudomonas yamanorum]|uniref:lysine exporter LysO family protein n=1 Tax=Pseudomonas yamanorum TaxID=515393 RepID=UPI003F74F532
MTIILNSILPIFLSLLVGWVIAKFLSAPLRDRLCKLITPFVWLLLYSIGYEFGSVLSSLRSAGSSVAIALVFALLTTAIPWLLLSRSGREERADSSSSSVERLADWTTIAKPLKECLIALFMLTMGVVTYSYDWFGPELRTWWPTTSQFLYGLVALVGVDLYGVRPDPSWYSIRTLKIPVLVVVGSLIGGAIASVMIGQPLGLSLALSSGFGWFTLSGVLVGQHAGETYGVVALLTDLFREFLAIALMYSLGSRNSRQCIAAGGATSLDSTLPIIKQTCSTANLPLALVSGFVLTLCAPFLISFFLS